MDLSLSDIRADIISRLEDAAGNRRSPMHTPVVATSDADVRVMVLRAFDATNWTLRFHTDARSPKLRAVRGDDRIGVLFYDREDKIQIRCQGIAGVASEGEIAEDAWRGSDSYARRCYLGEPPGNPSPAPTSGLPAWLEGVRPTEQQLLPARANFAVLTVQIETADWYSLAHDGHRRAVITKDGAEWLTP